MGFGQFFIKLLWILAVLVVYLLVTGHLLHGPVSGESLARSVGRASSSAGDFLGVPGTCRRRAARDQWRCEVLDGQGSGSVTYRVRVRPDSSCWNATLAQDPSEVEMPRRIRSCVHRREWSVFQLLLQGIDPLFEL